MIAKLANIKKMPIRFIIKIFAQRKVEIKHFSITFNHLQQKNTIKKTIVLLTCSHVYTLKLWNKGTLTIFVVKIIHNSR